MSRLERHLAASLSLTAVTAQPAEAKIQFIHHRNSDYSFVRVYTGWNCTGHYFNVSRGTRSPSKNVDCVYLGRGASLWRYKPSLHPAGQAWFRVAYAANGPVRANVGQFWEQTYMTRRGPNL